AGSLFGRGVRVAGRTCSRVQQVQDHGLQLGDAAAGFVCHGYASADVHAVYGGTAMVGRGAFAGREPAPQAAPWLPPHSAASARARSSRPNGLLSTGSVAKRGGRLPLPLPVRNSIGTRASSRASTAS